MQCFGFVSSIFERIFFFSEKSRNKNRTKIIINNIDSILEIRIGS